MSDKNLVLHHPDILELLPHRHPFLLVDRVDQIVKNESARGLKAITSTEPHLAGHFPGFPIMPGVLIIEAMAQTAGVLMAYSNRKDAEGKHVYFTTIDNAKFRSPARPGDLMYLNIKITGQRGMLYKFDGEATIDDKTVANAQFSAMAVEPGR
jgi:3-hydroxyacyl-[acyl-carrier-protein] dehydratase